MIQRLDLRSARVYNSACRQDMGSHPLRRKEILEK
jgi:hypothetical protein